MREGGVNRLGRYELRRVLWHGAMSTVYEGYDPARQAAVAVKVIDKAQVDPIEAEEVFGRFAQEARVAGELQHPNIVAVYDHGDADGMVYIVMEFVDGIDLADYLDAPQHRQVAEIVRLMLQILDALEYSHSHGVIHRDIKPENIMVARDGTVKVADFGIAKIESSNLTMPGTVVGTPFYMSPEQFTGPVDICSDLYSAGVVLYEMLTGIKPFTAHSLPALMARVMNETPHPPSELRRDLPPALDPVVLKAIAKRPFDRYRTASEFRAALKSAA